MKRAILVGGGTLAGVAAVLALNPDATGTATASSTASSASSGTTSGEGASSSGSGTGSGTAGSGSSSGTTTAGDGTYAGDVVDVGHNYGNVQVEITVSGGRIVDVTALETPQNDRRSSQISDVAIPYLVDQALTAQNADVAGVSGATYTSVGFASSLKSALVAAGLA